MEREREREREKERQRERESETETINCIHILSFLVRDKQNENSIKTQIKKSQVK